MAGKVKILTDGPYVVTGGVSLAKERAALGKEGEPEFWKKDKDYPKQKEYHLCRCGKSKDKPFCDNYSHTSTGFDGTETASMKKFEEQASWIRGPGIDLADVPELCASARFCHLAGGTWTNARNSGDSKAKQIAQQTAWNCPAGRLVVYDKKTGKAIEPKLAQSISLIEDTPAKVSGPIWLKGGIELESADGKKYETRNRVTICRCGKSKNKPFCDGAHMIAKFNDGDESLR
jgi:CDGSH-type Zn-finger protein